MDEETAASDGVTPLADPTRTKANCGVGVVMDLSGDGSHDVVADGLELLANLEHRGTTGAEADTGDGAGVLIQTPHEFLAGELDIELPPIYAVGSFFLPRDDDERRQL
jgi:glutamate synthase (NADPH/NADH) large chain